MITEDDYTDDPDFFLEVDEFMAALPCDEGRVKRIDGGLPESFSEVLQAREAAGGVAAPVFRVMPVVVVSLAIAAAVVGMVLLLVINHEPEGGQLVREVSRPGEMEFEVTIDGGREPEIVVRPVRRSGPLTGDDLKKSLAEERARNEAGEGSMAVVDVPQVDWYQTAPRAAVLPDVKQADWARTDVDRMVLAALEAGGIEPPADANWATRLRRLSFDLTGLPPSREMIERYQHDQSAAAYARVVDELLGSWQFGEHLAADWLQLAGYRASEGGSDWRYREYVIAAFNADKPYDRFLKEQLAGDLMSGGAVDDRAERLVATGLFRHLERGEIARLILGADGTLAPPEGSAKSVLAAGVSDTLDRFFAGEVSPRAVLRLDGKKYPADNLVTNQKAEAESKRLRGLLANAERRLVRGLERENLNVVARLRGDIDGLSQRLKRLELQGRDRVTSTGSFYAGRVVPAKADGARLAAAEELVSASHPLTARAFVNRVWGELFGRGLVDVRSGQSVLAQRRLLDSLAVDFVEKGWSTKSLVRELVMSRAYQLEVFGGGERRELEPRELRDSLLAVGGWLETAPRADGRARMFARGKFEPIDGLEDGRAYRSIYTEDVELARAGKLDEGLVFASAMAAAQRVTVGSSSDEWRVRDLFQSVLAREPSAEETEWAISVVGRGESLDATGVLVASSRPGELGERAMELEELLPRVTVDGHGGELVAWAALFHALMMTEEFRELR